MSEADFNKVFSKKLNYYLTKYDMTQLELSKKLNVGTTSVSNWCRGIKSPRMDKVDAMCKIFNCKRSDLMEDKDESQSTNSVTINVLGRVAAGIPLDAIEEIIDTEEISEKMASEGEYFALKIAGDSMEPKISNGDVVIVRKQSDADDGDLVIAMVNGNNAVCKRLKKYAEGIALVSNNPLYEPMYFSIKDIAEKSVTILGKVKELRAKF